ncbi:MAG: hypothetical protein KAR19_19280 [Bacteroidales bacterium]|nr:hypothetical protein [Bacteroidales bacterium]
MTQIKYSFISILFFLGAVSQTALADDSDTWPRKIEKDNFVVVIYQPQVEQLTANKLESRAAVSVTNEEFTSPVFGAMWFDCKIATDRDERIVRLIDLKVSAAKFPEVEEEEILKLSSFLESEIPGWELEMSLDQLLADLDMNEVTAGLSENLNNAPPEVIFTTSPSVLILMDGDPIYEKIEKSDYERVVNTPFFIVRDVKKGDYYIKGGDYWYTSDNPVEDFENTTQIPKKLEKIADEAMGDVEQEETESEESEAETIIPKVIVRTNPSELLQSNGEPDFSPIEGTSILYMTNTADDILMDIETQKYFILVAGRWYSSSSMTDGPWSFVDPNDIPAGFSDIPSESEMGSVRASIAGTQEAKEAVLENQIPQTAEVDRSEATLEVSYDGKPKFEPIKDTDMRYAVNTDKSVLLINKRYYCCDNAIWFESDSPTGPWAVSILVPESVQEIPPESPVYNVKYVYIYDSTPSVVYVGYTPGYVHSYAYGGCVYYGTGYHYHPWYGAYYYPRPVTYGYSVHYNPYTGWGFSFGVSYGWMTFGWRSPYYGWWGPAGYRHGYHYGYHHGYSRGYRAGYHAGRGGSYPARPTPYGSTRPVASNNVYKNRSQGVRRTGNTHYDPKTGNRVSSADRSTRPTAQPANRANNVYTDKSGNVYRRDGNDWNRVDNSRPSTSTRPSEPSTRPSQPSTRPSQPSTRPSEPSTRPSQPSTRPSQPSTRPSEPSTRPSQPSTRPSEPSTRPSQPSTRPSEPSTRPSQPSTRPSPTTRPSQPSARPSPNTNNLNRDYNSRNRGTQRSQQYNQNRQSNQYQRPSASPSQRPSASPSRSGSGRSGSAPRRR